MKNEANQPLKFERFKQLAKRVPYSRSTIDRLVSQGKFPRPYKLSSKSKAWLSSEVDAWMKDKIMSMEVRDV